MNHICSGSHPTPPLPTLNFAAHLRPRLMFCNTMLQPKLGCGSSAKSSVSHFHSLQNNFIYILIFKITNDFKIVKLLLIAYAAYAHVQHTIWTKLTTKCQTKMCLQLVLFCPVSAPACCNLNGHNMLCTIYMWELRIYRKRIDTQFTFFEGAWRILPMWRILKPINLMGHPMKYLMGEMWDPQTQQCSYSFRGFIQASIVLGSVGLGESMRRRKSETGSDVGWGHPPPNTCNQNHTELQMYCVSDITGTLAIGQGEFHNLIRLSL